VGSIVDEFGADVPEDVTTGIPGFQTRDLPSQRPRQAAAVVSIPNQIPQRRYLPTLSDLVDRLTITQQKMVFIPKQRDHYLQERADILHDIDIILNELDHKLTARAIMAITLIQLTNRYIWENEAHAREGGPEQDKLLKLTHSINGVRNSAKNILAEEAGGRKDYKVDCFAAELVEDFGNWNVFS
jgi:hypothetical protein